MTKRKPVDAVLLLVVGLLVAIGAVMVFSASSVDGVTQFHDAAYFLKRELLWIVLGGAAALFAIMIASAAAAPNHWMKRSTNHRGCEHATAR